MPSHDEIVAKTLAAVQSSGDRILNYSAVTRIAYTVPGTPSAGLVVADGHRVASGSEGVGYIYVCTLSHRSLPVKRGMGPRSGCNRSRGLAPGSRHTSCAVAREGEGRGWHTECGLPLARFVRLRSSVNGADKPGGAMGGAGCAAIRPGMNAVPITASREGP